MNGRWARAHRPFCLGTLKLMKPEEIKVLVTSGAEIRGQIEALKERLENINAQLTTLPKGAYEGDNGAKATVVVQSAGSPKPVAALLPTNIDQARKICGENFDTLFDRKVLYSPCESVESVADRVLTTAKARDLRALILQPGKPGSTYVKWS